MNIQDPAALPAHIRPRIHCPPRPAPQALQMCHQHRSIMMSYGDHRSPFRHRSRKAVPAPELRPLSAGSASRQGLLRLRHLRQTLSRSDRRNRRQRARLRASPPHQSDSRTGRPHSSYVESLLPRISGPARRTHRPRQRPRARCSSPTPAPNRSKARSKWRASHGRKIEPGQNRIHLA